ncbi:MAG: Mrp/NBP35 family ATP-binding protein [Firmicutes bacterium]|nr:Mrp/NBP35 family ATP-binding protein [Bacillota bacterium]
MSSSCDSCPSNVPGGCSNEDKQSCARPLALEASDVKKVIAVMSGKGGVGKSTVTSLLASGLSKQGLKVGILDADITGPSIPKMFGSQGKRLDFNALGMMPAETGGGIKMVSMNLLLEKESDPVIWRGPMIAGVVKQFWEEVVWGDLDYLLVDLPPGTGDVPLTVMQSLPVTGVVVVTSPQELVQMIVRKAIKMAEVVKLPVLGLVENLSYGICPDCGKEIPLFGASQGEQITKETGIPFLGRLPLDPRLVSDADNGNLEQFQADYLEPLVKRFLGSMKN